MKALRLLLCVCLGLAALTGCATHGPVKQRVDRRALLAYSEQDGRVLYFSFVEEVPIEVLKTDPPVVPDLAGLGSVLTGEAAELALSSFTEIAKAGYAVRHATVGVSAEVFAAGWEEPGDAERLMDILERLTELVERVSYSPGARNPGGRDAQK